MVTILPTEQQRVQNELVSMTAQEARQDIEKSNSTDVRFNKKSKRKKRSSPQTNPKVKRYQFNPKSQMSATQRVINSLFNDKNQMWGNNANPVTINRTLSKGNGLIKVGDGGQTGMMFGVRRQRYG